MRECDPSAALKCLKLHIWQPNKEGTFTLMANEAVEITHFGEVIQGNVKGFNETILELSNLQKPPGLVLSQTQFYWANITNIKKKI